MVSAWIGKMFDHVKPFFLIIKNSIIFLLTNLKLYFFFLPNTCFLGVASWMQTGERQTTRLRVKYLESILKKDISFFDTEARDANIVFHISSDAILVQDAIGDKVQQSHYNVRTNITWFFMTLILKFCQFQ